MSTLTNDQIANRVMAILNAIPRDPKIKQMDEVAILAGVDLIINLLQNINTIAGNK